MVIKIETEKVLKDGKQYRKILNITGVFERDELPKEYLKSAPNIYYSRHILVVRTTMSEIKSGICFSYYVKINGADKMIIDEMYPESTFQEMVKYITMCGNRLHKINKEKKNSWKGKETIEI